MGMSKKEEDILAEAIATIAKNFQSVLELFETQKCTIQELFKYSKGLEARIAMLEEARK